MTAHTQTSKALIKMKTEVNQKPFILTANSDKLEYKKYEPLNRHI